MKKAINYFSAGELTLWLASCALALLSHIIFGGKSTLTLIASLIGVTSLIFNAKANPFGQFLMVVFSVLYGIISYGFSYFGEMLTYLGMTAPMALFSMIEWLKNPYNGQKSEVLIRPIKRREIMEMIIFTSVVTFIFYFILEYFHTANMLPSTISVATSFSAVYLTARRSPYYALAYAANDIVLIVLWVMASFSDISYISVVICFIVFLANDIYGFINWKKIQKKQHSEPTCNQIR